MLSSDQATSTWCSQIIAYFRNVQVTDSSPCRACLPVKVIVALFVRDAALNNMRLKGGLT